MSAIDKVSRDQDALLSRLRNILGNSVTLVGTSFSEALAAVLEVDRRLSGRDGGLEEQLDRSDKEIYQLALDLDWALSHHTEFELPLGSKVQGSRPGTVEIDGECLVLDAGRPGLFALELTPAGAYGPNLDLLRSEVERLTRKLACRRIGLPSAVKRTHGDVRQLLQFPPLKDGGEVVLQRSAEEIGADRFCAASKKQIKNLAKEIVLDMRALWSKREAIAARVDCVRREAESAASEPALHVHSIVIEMKYQRNAENFALFVEYEGIDEAMRPGIVLQFVVKRDNPGGGYDRTRRRVDARQKQSAEFRSKGADGWIDDVALSVLAAAPEGMAVVLGRLSASNQTVIHIAAGNKPLYARLYWEEGSIQADLVVPGQLEWYNHTFDALEAWPTEVILASLRGRSLNSVVQMPLHLPCVIVDAEKVEGRGLRLQIDNKKQLINLSTGRVWPGSPQN